MTLAIKEGQDLLTKLLKVGWTEHPNGCHIWNGRKDHGGYGMYSKNKAHRLVVEALDEVTLGKSDIVRHTCDNPPCVNRAHLIVGTQQENILDMVRKGRHYFMARKECKRGHDLTLPGSRRRNYQGWNICVLCDRERHMRYNDRQARKAEHGLAA
jgi:hypothetical protein